MPDLESRGRHVAYLLKKYFGKEPDVQYHHDEELSGEVVLDAVRAERADSGDQRGLCDQGLLPSNGEEIGDDVETDPDH